MVVVIIAIITISSITVIIAIILFFRIKNMNYVWTTFSHFQLAFLKNQCFTSFLVYSYIGLIDKVQPLFFVLWIIVNK